MNGSEEARGARKAAMTIKVYMNNQPTPSDRAKTVHYGRHTTFGSMGDNDNNLRSKNTTSVCGFATPDADDSVHQPQRPLPPPKTRSRAQEHPTLRDNSAPPRNPAHEKGPAIGGSDHRRMEHRKQHGNSCSKNKEIYIKKCARVSEGGKQPELSC